MYEPDQPLTELVERCWKLLHRLGKKQQERPNRRTRTGDWADIMFFKVGEFRIRSRNRFLWVDREQPPPNPRPAGWEDYKSVISVDEEGQLGALDVIECAFFLELIRPLTILDDLAEIVE